MHNHQLCILVTAQQCSTVPQWYFIAMTNSSVMLVFEQPLSLAPCLQGGCVRWVRVDLSADKFFFCVWSVGSLELLSFLVCCLYMFLVTQSSGAKGWTGERIHGTLLAHWSVGSKAPPSKAGDASASSDSQLHRAFLQLRIKKSWPEADIRNIATLVPYCKSRLRLEIVYEHIQVTWPLFLFLSPPSLFLSESLSLFLSFALSLLLSLSLSQRTHTHTYTHRICLTDSIWPCPMCQHSCERSALWLGI